MKITLEIDPAPKPTPKSVTKSAPVTSAPSATPEPKSSQPTMPGKRDAVLQGNRVEKPKASEEESSQSAVGNSSLHSFDLQGGANNISDPERSNPNVFRFVMPKGEA